jgi:hypothetical protein
MQYRYVDYGRNFLTTNERKGCRTILEIFSENSNFVDLQSSVADPRHFVTDPDPGIQSSD